MGGVRHVETKKQGMQASILLQHLNKIFNHVEMQYLHKGDDEMQRRIYVDDVIMSPNCGAAYVHIGLVGSKLEMRQAMVWLIRNKPMLKSALARRFVNRARVPNLYFVESKFTAWQKQIEKAKQYPELNLPDPLARVRAKVSLDYKMKKWGIGDADKPYPKNGYGRAFVS